MNITVEKVLNEQIKEANYQACLKLIRSLDEKINRLRDSYKANQTNIKEAEAKGATAKDFEYLQRRNTEITRIMSRLRGILEGCDMQNEIYRVSGAVLRKGHALENLIASQSSELRKRIRTLEIEQEQILVALGISQNAVKFLATLETLRNRENEIKYEGMRLKEERESVHIKLEELKLYDSSHNQNNAETQMVVKEEISCKLGSRCLRLAEFLFSSKTCKEVFYPIVGDWREEYLIALRKGRIVDAVFISVKNYLSFAYTVIVCSKLGKLIEFIMKLAGVIEFFNKFSK